MKKKKTMASITLAAEALLKAAPDLDGGGLGPRRGRRPICGHRIFR